MDFLQVETDRLSQIGEIEETWITINFKIAELFPIRMGNKITCRWKLCINNEFLIFVLTVLQREMHTRNDTNAIRLCQNFLKRIIIIFSFKLK